MSSKIKILIVDDHEIFRRGLHDSLEEFPEFILVGEASNGSEAVEMCQHLKPDVVLMDIHMPGGDGIQAVEEIKKLSETHILMLTVSEKDQDLVNAVQAGADGYLLKNTKPDRLRSAINDVVLDRGVVSPEVTKGLLNVVSRSDWSTPELSNREHQVLALMARGFTTAKIAVSLKISENTAKTYIRRILRKFKATNRAEAVARASALGLLYSGN